MAKRAALALGSGGARGYAHIGVIDELQSRGYEVVGVAGSSMGALVGGLFAAGSLDEFSQWATTLTGPAVLRLLDPSISAAGVLRAGKILDAVRELLGSVTIEELAIPYTAVTTDLIAGQCGCSADRSTRRSAPRSPSPGSSRRMWSTDGCWPTAESSIRCRSPRSRRLMPTSPSR
jgi:hypothetical protein